MKTLLVLCLTLLSFACLASEVAPAEKVKDSINIRLEPDTNSDVVGRLRQGTSLPLVNSLDGWYEVKLEGDATGFVSADWARVLAITAAEASPEEASDSGDEAVLAAADEVDDVVDAVTVENVEPVAADIVEEAVAAVEVEVEVEETNHIAEPVAETTVADVATEEVVAVEVAHEAPAMVETQVVVGPAGPPGPPGAATIKGSQNFLVKFKKETEGGNSQIFDDGNQVGIGTTEPKQRLEVNGSIQIHEQNSSVAGLMITQSSGETGYIMHNRASTLTIGAGSQDRITIDREGNVGIGVARPSHPLSMASGAHVTAGGVWTNSSSRLKKENIAALSEGQAMAALAELEPVLFNYRNEQHEDYVGFIAEDVPALVASRDRETLSTMDIVAVLTKVVQAQQQKIEELEARLDAAEPSQ
ncbi:MAG: SH3 domain-containing protein [Woeseiaceae bacterium]